MSEPPDNVVLRPARSEDVPEIQQLIQPYIAQRKLLPRDEADLRGLVRNGFVAEDQGRLVGFAAIEVYSWKLAEVHCLAVAEPYQRRGLGKRLVQACVQLAREHNILELMAISSSEQFFMDCGFDYSLPDQKRALFIHPRDLQP